MSVSSRVRQGRLRLGLPPFIKEKAGHLFVGGLGDGSPPAGSRGRAPGGEKRNSEI